jgi:hypothetical protein
MSTRGQHLTALLQHRFTTQLNRRSSFVLASEENDVEAGTRSSGEYERLGPPHSRHGSTVGNPDGRDGDQRSIDERRFNKAALAVLMT